MNHGNVSLEFARGQTARPQRIAAAYFPFSKIEGIINHVIWHIRMSRWKPKHPAHWILGWGLLMLALAVRLPAEPTQVESRGLSDHSTVVVGELGLPLGTPVEVEGVIVSVKGYQIIGIPDGYVYYYRLAVDTVGGRKLGTPKNFSFLVEEDIRMSLMAQTEPELKKLLDISVEGDCAPEDIISREQADQYLRDYTKVRRKILVYESGRFIGRPRSLPQTWPATSAPDYKFETFLVVVDLVRPVAASLRPAKTPAK